MDQIIDFVGYLFGNTSKLDGPLLANSSGANKASHAISRISRPAKTRPWTRTSRAAAAARARTTRLRRTEGVRRSSGSLTASSGSNR